MIREFFLDFGREFLYQLLVLLVPVVLLANSITLSIPNGYRHLGPPAPTETAPAMTALEQLDLTLITITFLQHPSPPETAVRLLDRQRLPGSDAPLYNQRELAHLVDVKHLTDGLRRGGQAAALLLLAGLALLLRRPQTRRRAPAALAEGGWLSLKLLVATMVGIGVFWPIFFTLFHQLLFPPDSWTFAAADTLIRLFPERFWLNYTADLLLLRIAPAALALAVGGRWLQRRWFSENQVAAGRQAASGPPPAAALVMVEADARDFWTLGGDERGAG